MDRIGVGSLNLTNITAMTGDGSHGLPVPEPLVEKCSDDMRAVIARGLGRAYGDSSLQFKATNQNKQSITVDLKTDAGMARLFELLEDADVLITNWRPAAAERRRQRAGSCAGMASGARAMARELSTGQPPVQ